MVDGNPKITPAELRKDVVKQAVETLNRNLPTQSVEIKIENSRDKIVSQFSIDDKFERNYPNDFLMPSRGKLNKHIVYVMVASLIARAKVTTS